VNDITQTEVIGLRLTRELAARPEEVFAAYTDPRAQREWLSQLGPDEGEVRTTVDLRVGGAWEATFRPNPAVAVHDVQTYVEVDPPHRLVTRLVSESTVDGRAMPPIETPIDVTFTRTESGTRVTVEQSGFADTQTRDFFEHVAWASALDRIAAYLEGQRRNARTA
jgi:uncharacterized protein YndB with AHSA1/START domain